MYCIFAIYLLMTVVIYTAASHLEEKELSIAVLVPFETLDNGCTKKAIELAMNDINSLKNFIIREQSNETFKLDPFYREVDEEEGNAIEAMYNMYHQNKQKKIMVTTIGPPFKDQSEYCVEYTTSVANVEISYSDANEPMETYYVFWFQTPPSIVSSFFAARTLMDHYKWTRTAIIYDYSDKRYRKNADNLRDSMTKKKGNETSKIVILADQGIWSDPIEYNVTNELGALQAEGARIIFSLVSVGGARKIFCEAFRRKMYAPKVIWILFEILPIGWASDKYNSGYDKSTKKSTREITCTENEMLVASHGYIAITKSGLRRDGKKTISNMTADDFVTRLHKDLKPGTKCDENVAYAYDAVWVAALAHQGYAAKNDTSNYNDYVYLSFDFALELVNHIRLVKFEGLTGLLEYKQQISFIYNRIGSISIWSNQKQIKPILAGTLDTKSDMVQLLPNHAEILFRGGNVPKDKATYITSSSDFSKPLLIVMWLFASIGIVLSTCFFTTITIFFFTQERDGRFSSYIINSLIILGSNFCYASVIIYGLDTRFVSEGNTKYVCWGFVTSLSLGFTLAFGALFAKAWQLYKKYMTPEVKVADNQLKIKDVSEWSLILIISIFLAIDGAIIGTWVGVSPFETEIRNLTTTENLFDDKIRIEQIAGCTCKYETEFTIGMYCYKGIMLIFGIFIAWQTRNAKIKIQNESKQIAMAIYNVVAVSLIGVICVSVLTNTTRQQALYAIVAVCICICTTTTLLLIFLPKIRKILDSPNRFDVTRTSSGASSATEAVARKFTPSYMRKSMEKKTTNMEKASSTGTLTTQVSAEQSHHPSTGSLEHSPSVDESVMSTTPSYLSNSVFMTPPAYDESQEPKRKVDSMGRLSSGIYVGSIAEEETEAKADENNETGNASSII